MTLLDLFTETFRKYPEKLAFIFRREKVTFGQIQERAGLFSGQLKQLGVNPGDRIAIYLPNSLDFIYAYIGILSIGGVVVLMNVLYRSREAREIIEDSEAKILISDSNQLSQVKDLLPIIKEKLQILNIREVELFRESGGITPGKPLFSGDQNNLATICYTSGTTGRSKGAMLSHGNFTSDIKALIDTWAWTSQDILVLAVPMFHMHGLGVALNGALATGCSTVLLERFEAETVLTAIQENRCTLFMGVPTMYTRFLQVPHPERFDLSSMRLFISGSAPLSKEVFHEFRKVYGFEILERYGLTETIMNTSNPYLGKRKPGSIGLPLPGIQIRIVDKDGGEVEDGQIGEITVKGPNVFHGYWKRPEETSKTLADGWMFTGDLGVKDTEGYIQIVGRAKEVIINGGFNVYPREVEEVLCSHPSVKEAAVVGIPDKIRGELVKAYIVLNEFKCPVPKNPDLEGALIDYCKQNLASFKVPRQMEFLPSLPRTASGKVITRQLPNLT